MADMQQETAQPDEPIHFFISHTSVDLRWAEWIGWQLESAGYRVILDAWDFKAGTSFVGAMEDAAARAERTLLVVSPEYFNAVYTTPEWETAFAQDGTGRAGKLLPVIVRACELPNLLQRIIYIDLVGLDREAASERLLGRVSEERAKPETEPTFPGETAEAAARSPEPSFPGLLPPIWNVPHGRNPNFTGRTDLLSGLYDSLHAGNATVLRQALRGLGGVGKTQLALEYAYRYANDYSEVWWVPSETSPATVYAELSRELGLPEADAQESEVRERAVKHWLERHDGWLLVFDNAAEPDDVKPYLPQGASGHVIITSRYWDWGDVANGLGVEVFERDTESVPYLLRRTSQTDEAAARLLADALGNLPLALAQASTYIASTGTTLTGYTALFESRRDELWQQEKPPEAYPATVAVTWSLAIEEMAKESPESESLLYLLAYMAPEAVSRNLLLEGAEHLCDGRKAKSSNVLVSLYQRIRSIFGGDRKPVSLRNMVKDEVAWNRGLAAFRRYGLVEVTEAGLLVHRLVQAVTRDRLAAAERLAWAAAAVQVVEAAYPGDAYSPQDIGVWSRCADLLGHALVTTDHAEMLTVVPETVHELLNGSAGYLLSQGRYRDAEPLLQRALRLSKEALGNEHPSVATSLNNLAALYESQGRYEEAEPLYQQALEMSRHLLGEAHPSVATSLNNLAGLYESQGRYEEAEPLYQQALEMRRHLLGEAHPSVAASLNNLAALYESQGRYEEAEPLYQQALEMRRHLLGEAHPSVATSLNNLALLYGSQGRYEEAEPLYQQALEMRRHLLGEAHPSVATSLNNLALLYGSQGRYEEAEPLYQQALEMRRHLLGEAHPDVAASFNNLAGLYESQGRYEEAASTNRRWRCRDICWVKRILQWPPVSTIWPDSTSLRVVMKKPNPSTNRRWRCGDICWVKRILQWPPVSTIWPDSTGLRVVMKKPNPSTNRRWRCGDICWVKRILQWPLVSIIWPHSIGLRVAMKKPNPSTNRRWRCGDICWVKRILQWPLVSIIWPHSTSLRVVMKKPNLSTSVPYPSSRLLSAPATPRPRRYATTTSFFASNATPLASPRLGPPGADTLAAAGTAGLGTTLLPPGWARPAAAQPLVCARNRREAVGGGMRLWAPHPASSRLSLALPLPRLTTGTARAARRGYAGRCWPRGSRHNLIPYKISLVILYKICYSEPCELSWIQMYWSQPCEVPPAHRGPSISYSVRAPSKGRPAPRCSSNTRPSCSVRSTWPPQVSTAMTCL